jgi:DNA-binding protein HU-beta
MNKQDIISDVAKRTAGTKKEAESYIEAFIDSITDSLANGNKVVLRNFGTFDILKTKERRGVNPQTGESIMIPAKIKPKFTAGTGLREVVNK